ncbi:ABC transporter permease [Rudaeicoccus suwonensis]|uniref:Peptide/nickel transport system permease protein n=1 Tax=Rudaeicoccus suwonensis TaxID=657409 RepID=A0A561E7Y5_9MICO|nr:ABC transporter permease [Rudaeicoccus suwonensis]TWE11722.1 peptide/nickel transport system permease protein [Rudaeicoccus suwonensis]
MAYVRRKVILFVITLWAAITMNFALPRLMPGSPVDAALAKIASSGQPITNAQRRAVEIQLGSPHGSIISQYFDYLKNVATFNFGTSYSFPSQSVSTTILNALPWTLILVGMTTIIAFIIGTLLGVYAGWRRGTAADAGVTLTSTLLSAFPPFWLGLLLLYVFAFKWGMFPLKGGYADGASPSLDPAFIADAIKHSVLPGVTLAVTSLSGWVFGMRNNMINTLGEDYVTFAEANGIRPRTVALLYAARNALLPNVTAFGLSLGAIVGGSVLVEGIFSYPGLGNLLYVAVTNHDFPLMQALFLVITVSMLVAIFVVDLLYARLDPRVRR